MKKIILSTLVLLIFLSSNSIVHAKGKGGGRQNNQSRAARNKDIAQEQRETARKQSERGKIELEKQRVPAGKNSSKKEETQGDKLKDKSEALKKDATKGKSTENIGKGKGQQQQIKAFEKQMLHEEAKYRKRQAQFKRIRELATKKGNTTVLERLKLLEEKEQNRYVKKRKRTMERMQQLQAEESKMSQGTVEKNTTKGRVRTKSQTEKVNE